MNHEKKRLDSAGLCTAAVPGLSVDEMCGVKNKIKHQ